MALSPRLCNVRAQLQSRLENKASRAILATVPALWLPANPGIRDPGTQGVPLCPPSSLLSFSAIDPLVKTLRFPS